MLLANKKLSPAAKIVCREAPDSVTDFQIGHLYLCVERGPERHESTVSCPRTQPSDAGQG